MILRTTTALSFIALLSACGGSGVGAGQRTIPIASTGFAGTTGDTSNGIEFNVQDVTRMIGAADGTNAFKRQDVRLIVKEGGPIDVTIDGITYALSPKDGDPGDFIFEDGNTRIAVEGFLSGPLVIGYEVFAFLDDESINRGNIVVGLDTDPDVLDQVNGTASYTGGIVGTLNNGFDVAFADGTFEITTDFSTISGSATLVDANAGNADFGFSPVTIALEPGDISGNGFAGDVSVTEGELNGTLVSAEYEGRFFATEAQGIGGNIKAQIDIDNRDNDTYVEAIFVGGEVSD